MTFLETCQHLKLKSLLSQNSIFVMSGPNVTLNTDIFVADLRQNFSDLSGSNVTLNTDVFVAGLHKNFSDSRSFTTSSAPASSSWTAAEVGGVLAVSLIVPFILISNLMVIISVARFKRLQIPTNYFIVSLAVVDVFVAIMTLFLMVIEILPGQVKDMMLCLAPNRMLMTACGVSVLTLAAIAYDRHTALVCPLKYMAMMTLHRILLLVTLTWFYSAVIVWTPLLFGWFSPISEQETTQDASNLQSCSFQILHNSAHILFLCAVFGPACLAMMVCYFRIYMVARHHAKAIAAVESSVHHHIRMRYMFKDAKCTKTLALIIGVFLVLWLPYFCCMLLEILAHVHFSPWLWNYLTLLAVLNSGLNPWIYAFKNKEFGAASRKIFRICCSVGNTCFGCSNLTQQPSNMSNDHTTTTTNLSRMSRLSRGSLSTGRRLSDVPYVVSAVSPVVSNVHVNGLDHHTVYSASRGCVPVNGLPPVFETVEAKGTDVDCVHDNHGFIPDLLDLYLRRCVTNPHFDVEAQDSEAGAQRDRDDAEHSDNGEGISHCSEPSDHGVPTYCSCDSDHTEHTYVSDHTEHGYHTDDIDQGHHSSHTARGHHSDHSENYAENGHHTDQTEGVCHSDHTECGYHSDHTEHNHHRDHTQHSCYSAQDYHSDHTEPSYHIDQSYHSDHIKPCYHSDHSYHGTQRCHSHHSEPSYHSDHIESCYHSDYSYHDEPSYHSDHIEPNYHNEPNYHSDHIEPCYDGDHIESCYRSDHSYYSDHIEPNYHSDHSEQRCHSDHIDPCYHSDHIEPCDHIDHCYHSDHCEPSCHSDQSYHGDHSEPSCHSDQSYHGDHSGPSCHSDQSYHGDHRGPRCHSDHTEPNHHSDHIEPCYHSDQRYHSDQTEQRRYSNRTGPSDHTE